MSDDTKLIQDMIDKAIKNGEPIIIPAGTYQVKGTLKAENNTECIE